MAKAKKPAAANINKTTVTRIKASDSTRKNPPQSKQSAATQTTVSTKTSTKPTKKAAQTDTAAPAKKSTKARKSRVGIFARIRNYIRGSWRELKQVRWPSRAATWRMTGALILFVLLFTGFIVLLDTFFNFIFTKALGA